MAVTRSDTEVALTGNQTSPHSSRVVRASVESAPLDVALLERLVDIPEAGACVTFVGRVRNHDEGRAVTLLEYSEHPRTASEAVRIASSVCLQASGVRAMALSHRVGHLQVGDIAIACAVSADHRGQAFEACRTLVETVKRELPIWKHQFFADGTEEWVGSA